MEFKRNVLRPVRGHIRHYPEVIMKKNENQDSRFVRYKYHKDALDLKERFKLQLIQKIFEDAKLYYDNPLEESIDIVEKELCDSELWKNMWKFQDDEPRTERDWDWNRTVDGLGVWLRGLQRKKGIEAIVTL